MTGYTYDVQDHLSAVTDAEGNVTSYTTSDRDLATQEVSPVSGTTTYAYNEHGQRVSETDARSVTVSKTYDGLDRLTFVDYPTDNDEDTTYTYDSPSVPFSKGRLTSIARNGGTLSYTYDRFGRPTQDGDLTYSYDRNGNTLTIGYPNSVTATYTYDFANRQSTLHMQDGTNPVQTLVSSSSYEPLGPLASLTLGNGLTEAHNFNSRYLPTSITVPSLLSWTYSTDSVGNPTGITDTLHSANNRSYTYQDPQYFLTTGNGPWGLRSWTYDRIGDRLTETRGTDTDLYSYVTNGSGGNTPLIDSISLSSGSVLPYTYDSAGNVTFIDALYFAYGDDRRMSANGFSATTSYSYDGRGFLDTIGQAPLMGTGGSTTATYSSAGVLHHLEAQRSSMFVWPPTNTDVHFYFFYFAGRPVASLVNDSIALTSTLQFLSTDHLGTPILITDSGGSQVWQGGYEPFGADYSTSATPLRLPGQWADSLVNAQTELDYNVNRWYDSGVGRYTQVDPLGLDPAFFKLYGLQPSNVFTYTDSRPTLLVDPLGLQSLFPGTTDCKYYDGICKAQQGSPGRRCCGGGSTYYCKSAPIVCSLAGNNRLSNCIRKCLQVLDQALGCPTYSCDPAAVSSSRQCIVRIHEICFFECGKPLLNSVMFY